MDAKLTLKLNENSIQKAKEYALQKGISLSSLVEKFFDGITSKNQATSTAFQYSPLVQELSGIVALDEGYDYKKDYEDYLGKKYE